MAKKKTIKEKVAEIEARIPEIRSTLLGMIEEEKSEAHRNVINTVFRYDVVPSNRNPFGFFGPTLSRKKTPSQEYLSKIVREYNADGTVYAAQFGIMGTGHSDYWDNGGNSRRMWFRRAAGWKAYCLWFQLDPNIDVIYMALIKIGNKWFQLNISTGSNNQIFWREGFRSKDFQY